MTETIKQDVRDDKGNKITLEMSPAEAIAFGKSLIQQGRNKQAELAERKRADMRAKMQGQGEL